jgi:hypothetical protein
MLIDERTSEQRFGPDAVRLGPVSVIDASILPSFFSPVPRLPEAYVDGRRRSATLARLATSCAA